MTRMSRPRTALALALVIAFACGLSAFWAFYVPIYQVPDEPHHLDYALCLSESHHLFRAKDMPQDVAPLYMVHPWTHTMLERLEMNSYFTSQPPHPMFPEFGTPEFQDDLNRSMKPREEIVLAQTPSILRIYPFGYYTVVAGWIETIRLLDGRFTSVFYGARLLSVLLLSITLLFTYGTLRELGHRRIFSLLVTLAIGTFPLTSFISCYVQPDNLSLCLVSAAFFTCLRARRLQWRPGAVACLGLVLGCLVVTKLHFFLCVTTAVSLLLLSEWLRYRELRKRWLSTSALLITPALLLGSVHAWTVWGTTNHFFPPAEHTNLVWFTVRGLAHALGDFYWKQTHKSFWGVFGWMDTPLAIGTPTMTYLVRLMIHAAIAVLMYLTLRRLGRVVRVSARMVRAGHARWAFGLIASNPVLNSYFLFAVLMIAIYVRLDNRFGAQGRNWLPMILPIFLTGIAFAPGALRQRQRRAIVAKLTLAGLLAFCAVGGSCALLTLKDRYYPDFRNETMSRRTLPVEHSIHEMGAEQASAVEAWDLPDGPHHVYGIRIRYALRGATLDQVPCKLRWSGPGAKREILYWLKPTLEERTATFWPNETMSSFRFLLEDAGVDLEIREIVLLERPKMNLCDPVLAVRRTSP